MLEQHIRTSPAVTSSTCSLLTSSTSLNHTAQKLLPIANVLYVLFDASTLKETPRTGVDGGVGVCESTSVSSGDSESSSLV